MVNHHLAFLIDPYRKCIEQVDPVRTQARELIGASQLDCTSLWLAANGVDGVNVIADDLGVFKPGQAYFQITSWSHKSKSLVLPGRVLLLVQGCIPAYVIKNYASLDAVTHSVAFLTPSEAADWYEQWYGLKGFSASSHDVAYA